MDHAVFTLDLEGNASDWNLGAEQVFDHGREIIGRPAGILYELGMSYAMDVAFGETAIRWR